MKALAEIVNAVLPQTQCTRCGYPDCSAYANAIAIGEAAINQCPPGGAKGIALLSAITGQSIEVLNPANGTEKPRELAVIDEAWCIGCTLCLDACPTDAIWGSSKSMHYVIDEHCTGCERCLPVCPMDCIQMEVPAEPFAPWSQDDANRALKRYQFHQTRLVKQEQEEQKRLEVLRKSY